MKKVLLITLLVVLASSAVLYVYARPVWVPVYQKVVGKRSIDDVVKQYGEIAEARLTPFFQKAEINYPPKQLTLLAIKDDKRLELWASDGDAFKFIKYYPVQAASGVLGPKLQEGDKQVPEGIYKLEYLNPNSAYHLSMKINYPNDFDLLNAKLEGRDSPGTNIFIHGKALSIGCLAMGDPAIEELFILVSKVDRNNVNVAIAPQDPRLYNIMELAPANKLWVQTLYAQLTEYFAAYKTQ